MSHVRDLGGDEVPIYVLELKERITPSKEKEIGKWFRCQRKVVKASSMRKAREFAAIDAKTMGSSDSAEVWLDGCITTCTKVTRETTDGVISAAYL